MVSSSLELLVLHGVRVLGAPSVGDVARVYELDPAMVAEHLLDAEAYGCGPADTTGSGPRAGR